MSKRIAMIPGDGIGIEVTAEVTKVLQKLRDSRGLPLDWVIFDWGAEKYLREGVSLPEGALDMLRREFYAIFIGAVGDPRVPSLKYAVDILQGIRFGLDLYVNQRPVKLLARKLCPLKNRTERDINFVILRENTEGLYAGVGGNFKRDTSDEVAVQEDVNTRKGVERILVHAFEYARRHGLTNVCMSDKSNAMPLGHGLWQRTFAEVRGRYAEIRARHLYVDTLAMEILRDPRSSRSLSPAICSATSSATWERNSRAAWDWRRRRTSIPGPCRCSRRCTARPPTWRGKTWRIPWRPFSLRA